jgi:hypothetical protein
VHFAKVGGEFKFARRSTLFEGARRRFVSMDFDVSREMEKMFEDLPAIVRDIRDFGEGAIEIWN